MIDRELAHSPKNYAPLPLVIDRGEGAWVWDVDGNRYLDCMAAYSAANFGHANERFLAAAKAQLERVTITSRALHATPLGPFLEALASLAGKELVLPMNTGAEANETAVKIARKWGYTVKGVAEGRAKVVAMRKNFHGRTTTMISMSDDPLARENYGPYTPGFELVDFGDVDQLRAAIDDDTVAVMLEPIQGEAGIIVPPDGYLQKVRELTRERNVLLVCDEVQTGLGRTGATFRHQAEGIEADLITVGKSLGAGIVPVSAVIGDSDVMGVLAPGTHGSTFGGNPMAAAIALAVCQELATGEPQERSRTLGERLHAGLARRVGSGVSEVRGMGLWAGVDIDPAYGSAKDICLGLLARGVLAKDTQARTIRFAPPFVVGADEIDLLLREFGAVLDARRP
ncbi:ornithine--oxo-acid transaminase [Pseudoclavibacter endophyticus]|uniref:ornithine aminotransferase n=1 Tax=Pseudoclavibacter endophyticus TaxID=1778590 RepID=A0A6H9WQL6_9MICO|nr:ornithine--oxo-acid transaminase [Pseudoclavibacter endophyticus]